MQYDHVFFDLDHTLWDLQVNSRATLLELHAELSLAEHGIDPLEFIDTYENENSALWGRYRNGQVQKEVLRILRFRNTLLTFGVKNDRISRSLGEAYVERSPHRTALIPGARELLDRLHGKVRMHVITNGFEEVQHIKLQASDLSKYFDQVVTSERARAKKPDPRIFALALQGAKASPGSCLMVGDDLHADVNGARLSGIDQVHFDPEGTAVNEQATYRIRHMDELTAMFSAL